MDHAIFPKRCIGNASSRSHTPHLHVTFLGYRLIAREGSFALFVKGECIASVQGGSIKGDSGTKAATDVVSDRVI